MDIMKVDADTPTNNHNNIITMEEEYFDQEGSSVVDTNARAILQLMEGEQAEAIALFVSLLTNNARTHARTGGVP